MELAKQVKSPMGIYLQQLDLQKDYISVWFGETKHVISDSNRTRIKRRSILHFSSVSYIQRPKKYQFEKSPYEDHLNEDTPKFTQAQN